MSACSTASCVVTSASPATVATTAGLPPSYVTWRYLTPVAFEISSMPLWPADVTPAVATDTLPGCAFIASNSCFGFWYGVDGLTPMTWMFATVRNRFQSVIFVFSEPSVS